MLRNICFPFLLIFIGFFAVALQAQSKADYMKIIHQALDYNIEHSDEIINRWKSNIEKSDLFGYSTTSYPAIFANLLGFIYQETGEDTYAHKAADMLLVYEELKELFPREYYKDRIEYAKGLPPISNFFSMYTYPKAYLLIKSCQTLDAGKREIIEQGVADCANFLLNYPEWGPMNRAILRSETFYYASLALPGHNDRPTWEKMAEILSSSSYQRWEEEDATGYHAVWMLSLLRMIEATDRQDFYRSAVPRFYFDYFANLITPYGLIADFGDARWPTDWHRFIAIFEKGASVYQEPLYKWAVKRIWSWVQKQEFDLNSAYVALSFIDAYNWADETISPQPPEPKSRLVMEDLVGKKVLFRNGSDLNSTYLLLNYRDEGEASHAGREFLRTSITAEEEKTHHGHSDENSVISFFYKGSILLHDGGYRDNLPSGKYGQFRADYFHNRLVVRKNMRWRRLDGEPPEQQNLWEFLRNSGAYRPVQTRLINFLHFEQIDYSRSRLTDEELGYHWDRIVLYHKTEEFFVVIDAVKLLRQDFFTLANLWHTRKIHSSGEKWFDTEIDSIGNLAVNPGNNRLLVYFPIEEHARDHGHYDIERHWQQETTLYEALSAMYYPRDMEMFITVLVPHAKHIDPKQIVNKFKTMRTDKYPFAIGLEYHNDSRTDYIGIKGDLQMDYVPQHIRPRYDYEQGKVTYGPFESDANLLFASVGEEELYWAASNMIKVKYMHHLLHQSLEMSFGLQPDGAPPRDKRAKWRCWEETTKLEK
jgi:hypothetical protein